MLSNTPKHASLLHEKSPAVITGGNFVDSIVTRGMFNPHKGVGAFCRRGSQPRPIFTKYLTPGGFSVRLPTRVFQGGDRYRLIVSRARGSTPTLHVEDPGCFPILYLRDETPCSETQAGSRTRARGQHRFSTKMCKTCHLFVKNCSFTKTQQHARKYR